MSITGQAYRGAPVTDALPGARSQGRQWPACRTAAVPADRRRHVECVHAHAAPRPAAGAARRRGRLRRGPAVAEPTRPRPAATTARPPRRHRRPTTTTTTTTPATDAPTTKATAARPARHPRRRCATSCRRCPAATASTSASPPPRPGRSGPSRGAPTRPSRRRASPRPTSWPPCCSSCRTAGARLSSRQLAVADAMIRRSDHESAWTLFREVGLADGMEAANRRFGLRATQCFDYSWGLTRTTARDQLRFLAALDAAGTQVLAARPPARPTVLLDLMEDVDPRAEVGHQRGRPRRRAGLPQERLAPPVDPRQALDRQQHRPDHQPARSTCGWPSSARRRPPRGSGIEVVEQAAALTRTPPRGLSTGRESRCPRGPPGAILAVCRPRPPSRRSPSPRPPSSCCPVRRCCSSSRAGSARAAAGWRSPRWPASRRRPP